jgi:oligopeptide transport system permease protein
VPTFVLGPILVLFFSLTMYWFPAGRWDGLRTRSAVLPVLTLSVIYMAYIARLTRSGMLEVCDRITSARREQRACRNRHRSAVTRFAGGIIPVVSLTGPALAG